MTHTSKVDLDEPVPEAIKDVWSTWRFPIEVTVTDTGSKMLFPKKCSLQLHGFSNVSKDCCLFTNGRY